MSIAASHSTRRHRLRRCRGVLRGRTGSSLHYSLFVAERTVRLGIVTYYGHPYTATVPPVPRGRRVQALDVGVPTSSFVATKPSWAPRAQRVQTTNQEERRRFRGRDRGSCPFRVLEPEDESSVPRVRKRRFVPGKMKIRAPAEKTGPKLRFPKVLPQESADGPSAKDFGP